jgi:predicted RNase H-like HicB family nuclease
LNPYLHKEYAIVAFIFFADNKMIEMFSEYIQAAMEKAQYKLIDNGEVPYFIEIPELDGVWATGQTAEDARRNFLEVLEDWIAAHLVWNLALPPIKPVTHQARQISSKTFPSSAALSIFYSRATSIPACCRNCSAVPSG